jgi:hypothetical protein
MNFIDHFNSFTSSATSYFVGLWGLIASETFVASLGALILVVRLAYDSLRFYRYLKNPHLKVPE